MLLERKCSKDIIETNSAGTTNIPYHTSSYNRENYVQIENKTAKMILTPSCSLVIQFEGKWCLLLSCQERRP